MSTHVWFTRTQWSVGQGFFHSGEVETLGTSVLYVFDCGSFDGDALDREIDEFLNRHRDQQIDMLFVSHFHYDHVSGLPRLLREASVKAVIIPVIEPIERLAVLGATISEDALESWAVDFAADPEGALRDLNPEIEVIGIETSEEDPSDTDDPLETDDDVIPEVEIGVEGAEDLDEPSDVQVKAGETSTVQGSSSTGDTVPLWIWKAYTTKFARQRHVALLHELALQPGLSAAAIQAAMKNASSFRRFVQAHHAEISAAFAKTFSDVNLSSLLVYSGPASERKYQGRGFRTRSRHFEGKEIGAWDILPGWFGVGDQRMGVRLLGCTAGTATPSGRCSWMSRRRARQHFASRQAPSKLDPSARQQRRRPQLSGPALLSPSMPIRLSLAHKATTEAGGLRRDRPLSNRCAQRFAMPRISGEWNAPPAARAEAPSRSRYGVTPPSMNG